MKVLHITSWYPTFKSKNKAIWIQRHLRALTEVGCTNTVYHIETGNDANRIAFGQREILGNLNYTIKNRYLPWFVSELLATIMVILVLWKERKAQYSCINFHIAYPNLTYWHLIKKYVSTPVVITEHWSAYHFNFGLQEADQLPRIQRIFGNGLPIVCVSKALENDIKKFAKQTDFRSYIIPNVVDKEVFCHDPALQVRNQFFVVSQWKHPKDPFSIIRSFDQFAKKNDDYRLVVGGYGPQLDKMKELVQSLGLFSKIIFKGKMSSQQIAKELNRSLALIHLSTYETFSVVCAEAICCGCPVLASAVGGITEFIHEKNGILISPEDNLTKIMDDFMLKKEFKRSELAKEGHERFELKTVGNLYLQVLKSETLNQSMRLSVQENLDSTTRSPGSKRIE